MITAAFRGGFQGAPGWWLGFEYSAELIDALKGAVPHHSRTWDADRKLWWVAGEFEDELLRLLPGFEAYLAQGQLL